jgi:DNA-binding GntR family transcriptional regulator
MVDHVLVVAVGIDVDESPDPRRYLRVASDLRVEIRDGLFLPGQPVPSITALQRRYGYSRPTIAKGLRALEREGLLCRVRGLGYHVPSESLSLLVVPL